MRCIAAFDKSKSKEEIEDYVKLGFAVPDFKELKSNMLVDRDKFLMVRLGVHDCTTNFHLEYQPIPIMQEPSHVKRCIII